MGFLIFPLLIIIFVVAMAVSASRKSSKNPPPKPNYTGVAGYERYMNDLSRESIPPRAPEPEPEISQSPLRDPEPVMEGEPPRPPSPIMVIPVRRVEPRLRLFSSREECVKAVLYSEILRPKFRA